MPFGSRPGLEPVESEHVLSDRQVLSFAGELRLVNVPGHAAGQVGFLPPNQRVLLAADAVSNLIGLVHPSIFEDTGVGVESLRGSAKLDFALACFGHAGAIVGSAAEAFRRKRGGS